MSEPFSDQLNELSDNMGVALYQRFSFQEATLFLRCTAEKLKRLLVKRKIEFLQLDGDVAFFGYQLLSYLLEGIQPKLSPTMSQETLDRIIRTKEVLQLTGLSRTTIWRLENQGKFPARLPLGVNSIGWRLSDIQKWIEACWKMLFNNNE